MTTFSVSHQRVQGILCTKGATVPHSLVPSLFCLWAYSVRVC